RRAGLSRGPRVDRLPDQRPLPGRRPPLDAHGRDARGAPAPVPRGEHASRRGPAGRLAAPGRGPGSPAPGRPGRPHLPPRPRARGGFAGGGPERVPRSGASLLSPAGTLLFTRSDVAALLDLSECIEAVEAAFRSLGEGKVDPPGILGVPGSSGGFHIKAGVLPRGERRYVAAKIHGHFPGNPSRHGLPAI